MSFEDDVRKGIKLVGYSRHKYNIKNGRARLIKDDYSLEKSIRRVIAGMKKEGPFSYSGELEEYEKEWIKRNTCRYNIADIPARHKILDEWTDMYLELKKNRRDLKNYEVRNAYILDRNDCIYLH